MTVRALVFFTAALVSTAYTRQAEAEGWTGSDENSRLIESPTAGSSNGSYFHLVRLFRGDELLGAAGKRVGFDGLENVRRGDLKDLSSFRDFKYRYIGLGKRNMDSHRFYVGLGKRNMDSHRFYVGLGKRGLVPALAKQNVDDYEISIGLSKEKLSLNKPKHRFYHNQSPAYWRREEAPASSFDGQFYETTPLQNREMQKVESEYFSEGSNNPEISSFLDKRGMDSYYFNVGLGKRLGEGSRDERGHSSSHADVEKDKRFLSVRGTEGRRYFKNRPKAPHGSNSRDKKRQLNPYYFKVGLGKRQAGSAAISQAVISYSEDSLPLSVYDAQADKSELDAGDDPVFISDNIAARSWVATNDNGSDDDQETMDAISGRLTEGTA